MHAISLASELNCARHAALDRARERHELQPDFPQQDS
jgi:hypothetical protein